MQILTYFFNRDQNDVYHQLVYVYSQIIWQGNDHSCMFQSWKRSQIKWRRPAFPLLVKQTWITAQQKHIPLCHSKSQLNGDSLEGTDCLLSFSLPLCSSLSVNPWETSIRSGSFEAGQWQSAKYSPQSSESLDYALPWSWQRDFLSPFVSRRVHASASTTLELGGTWKENASNVGSWKQDTLHLSLI